MIASGPLLRMVGTDPVRAVVQQGFRAYARRRTRQLARFDPVETQRTQLRRLVRAAASTRFGRDHGFASITTVADYQARVPLRTYEQLWNDYLASAYPRFDGITWPGTIPYLALTSGTTQGATKYLPISKAMIASNRQAAQTMVAYHLAARPDSKLFRGKIFFLGGSTDLAEPSPGVREGDLSGIAAAEAGRLAPTVHVPAARPRVRNRLGSQAHSARRAVARRANHDDQRGS